MNAMQNVTPMKPKQADSDSEIQNNDRLGELLIKSGKLTQSKLNQTLTYARQHNMRLGEAAVKLKHISVSDLDKAIAEQFDFHYLQEGDSGYSKTLIAAFDPFSKKGQALRHLRLQLARKWEENERKTLAIVGAREGEGCSYLAANLAVVYSQTGHRTLLIDANMANPKQHELFGISNEIGLSTALARRCTFGAPVRKLKSFRNLCLMPSGANPPNPGELLSRTEFADIVPKLAQLFDMIIIDTPPASENQGAEIIAGVCGKALAVMRRNRTSMNDASATLQLVRSSGAEIVGSVMCES
jgi:receptor protein-tyrosine kinase